jgi:hypothetical protein
MRANIHPFVMGLDGLRTNVNPSCAQRSQAARVHVAIGSLPRSRLCCRRAALLSALGSSHATLVVHLLYSTVTRAHDDQRGALRPEPYSFLLTALERRVRPWPVQFHVHRVYVDSARHRNKNKRQSNKRRRTTQPDSV